MSHKPLTLPGPHHTLARRWYHDPRWRLAAAAVLGVGTYFFVQHYWPIAYSLLVAWSVTAFLYSFATALAVGQMNPVQTRAQAAAESPHALALHILLLFSAMAALIGVVLLLVGVNTSALRVAVITLLTVTSSWTVVQIIYTLRYARQFFAQGGGIDFNMDTDPQYSDFAYVAFTMGMTFQTSDTVFTTSKFRSIALGHALLTYIFGTVFLASIINVLASLSGS
jgi:uncharacterized membrane protein